MARQSVPVRKLKRLDCLCSYINLCIKHPRNGLQTRGHFAKPLYRGLIIPGSCDQFYIYDTGILTRRSVPVRKLKIGDCPCRHMNGLCTNHIRKGLCKHQKRGLHEAPIERGLHKVSIKREFCKAPRGFTKSLYRGAFQSL